MSGITSASQGLLQRCSELKNSCFSGPLLHRLRTWCRVVIFRVLLHEVCLYSNITWRSTDGVLDETSFVNRTCKFVCRKKMQNRFFQIKIIFSNTFLASTNKISQILHYGY